MLLWYQFVCLPWTFIQTHLGGKLIGRNNFFLCLMSCDREFCGNGKMFGEVMWIKGFIGNLGEDFVQNGP